MEGGEKVPLPPFFFFWLTRTEIESSRGKKRVLGYPIARATSYCLLPDTF